MNLYDEEELRKKVEKSKKMRNIVLVSIVVTLVLIVILIGAIYYLIDNPNKITILLNGNEDEQLESMVITKISEDGNTLYYYPIRKLASKFKYNSYNGDYGVNVENSKNCYIESENEVAIFTEDSNIIYKIDKTTNENDYEYDEIRIDNPVIRENDVLYVETEGFWKVFNFRISIDSKMKKINITTLNQFIASAEKILSDNKLGSLDDKLINKKAILDNMMIIVSSTSGKKGVRNYSTKEEILGAQYDDITYVPEKKSFMITKDGKVGIIDYKRVLKIKPQYDKLLLIDSRNGLYLAEANGYCGVLDENGNTKIDLYYSKIGVDISNFKENGLKTGYVLLERIIPIKKMNGKWIFFRIDKNKASDGTINVQCTKLEIPEIDDIGCVTNMISPTISNLMVIKDYNIIVIKLYNQYGFMDMQGKFVLGVKFDSAYLETTSNQTNYYATYDLGNQIDVIEEFKKFGYTKSN